MYKLKFDEKALNSIANFPNNIKERIIKKLKKAKLNPFHYFEKLSGRSEYKLRVGDYRVIADIDNKEILILILFADHRKRVYKKL